MTGKQTTEINHISRWQRHRKPLLSFLMTGSLMSISATGCVPAGEDDDDTKIIDVETDPSTDPVVTIVDKQPTPPTGQTSFHSADGYNGQATQENADQSEEQDMGSTGADDDNYAGEAGGDERVAEEGDIYRVLNGAQNYILNLNQYRGLQIIDFSDVENPEIVGRVTLSGTPVEMYQVGDRLYVLLNNWYSYWRSERYSTTPERHYGGGVVVVDISDKANPSVVTQAPVDGWIRTSRLTRGNGKEALYVVSNEWQGGGETNVNSFSVSEAGKLVQKSSISLGGYVQDIQATGSRLLVSRYDYQQQQDGRSSVSVIDISSDEGDMVEGQSITVKGQVRNKFNMHLQDNILRIVSGNSWGSATNVNHVETFDASDISNITPIDHESFGENEDLYATLFMEDRAFFVTYRRTDPFHAFSITPTGQLQEESEFIISGWNDYFVPVSQKSRLVGIGKNDENGRNTMAVSLYDVTDLTNPNPLITRAEIELDHSWSEAEWDDRAFSVLEKATSLPSGDGTATETGMILLPFSGWNGDEQRYVSAVQIYTFSKDTLTLRGVMDHGSQVRRSFVADSSQKTTGNLSELELSLFNTQNPDSPVEEGRIELAPNYASFEIFGDYGVRHHDRSSYYGWWGNYGADQARLDSLQIVPLSADDVDTAEPVATIEIPAHANTYRVQDNLIVVSTTFEPGPDNDYRNGTYTSDIEVWDMSMPAMPTLKSSFETDRIESNNYYNYWGGEDCWDCGYYYGYNYKPEAYAVNNALAFPSYTQQSELLGTTTYRRTYPDVNRSRYDAGCYSHDGNYTPKACIYYGGSIRCSQLTHTDGTVEPEICQGNMFRCQQDNQGEQTCEPIDENAIATREHTYENETYRRWTSVSLDVLDLTDSTNPQFAPPVSLSDSEEFAGIATSDTALHVSVKVPYKIEGDSRPYVKYYDRKVDLSTPSSPAVHVPINIPGSILEVDGETLITQDLLWGEKIIEASINKLTVQDGLAYLQGTTRFEDQQVNQVMLDRAGHVLVDHKKAWLANYEDNYYDWDEYDQLNKLTLIDLEGEDFTALAEVEIDNWAQLKDARAGRALYQVPGGLLVINLDNEVQPYAQAYFPIQGWPQDVRINDDTIYFSAGRYGLYHFDVNASNLLIDSE